MLTFTENVVRMIILNFFQCRVTGRNAKNLTLSLGKKLSTTVILFWGVVNIINSSI